MDLVGDEGVTPSIRRTMINFVTRSWWELSNRWNFVVVPSKDIGRVPNIISIRLGGNWNNTRIR
mgnify:CR=1 FL=1